ncbi:MAG: GDSL-type esterase/lipase family protein [Oscillospiraceae bacterium]|nr:GDSL-type esterase/lipase family protein [Oscillospiraceae bacterium]
MQKKRKYKRRSSANAPLIAAVAILCVTLIALTFVYISMNRKPSETGSTGTGTGTNQQKTADTTPETGKQQPTTEYIPPVTADPVVPTTEQNTTAQQTATHKPADIDDIIAIADSLNIDVNDLSGFSLDGLYPGTILKKTEDAGELYQSETIFVGDSVTLALSYWKYHPKEKVYYFETATPYTVLNNKLVKKDDGTLITFTEEMKNVAPRRIVITIGTNATSISDKTFIKYYGDLIDALREACPDTELIINSIPPLTAYCDENPNYKVFKNFRINRMNLLLVGLAAYKDVPFMNLAEEFKDEAGQLKKAYSSDDTCHVNQSGCDAWLKYFREHSTIAQ